MRFAMRFVLAFEHAFHDWTRRAFVPLPPTRTCGVSLQVVLADAVKRRYRGHFWSVQHAERGGRPVEVFTRSAVLLHSGGSTQALAVCNEADGQSDLAESWTWTRGQ